MASSGEDELSELDAALAADGQDVVLRRVVGTSSPVNYDCVCRAFVRGYTPQEMAGMIIQGDSKVIISSTQIDANAWPGDAIPASEASLDRRVPRRGDKLVVAGRVRNIENASPIYIGNVLVRVDMQVRG